MKCDFKIVPVDRSNSKPVLPSGLTAIPVVVTVDLTSLARACRDRALQETGVTQAVLPVMPETFAAMFAETFCADVYYRRVYEADERFEGQGVDERWTKQPAIYKQATAASA